MFVAAVRLLIAVGDSKSILQSLYTFVHKAVKAVLFETRILDPKRRRNVTCTVTHV
jgi:hypothetical protein